jgi:hypothetical protein
LAVVAVASAQRGQYVDPKNAAILAEARYLSGDGSFGSAYVQEDGVEFKEETDTNGDRKGQYSYVDPNGKKISVQYTAGKNGFQVQGDHLPKAPQAAPVHQQRYKLLENISLLNIFSKYFSTELQPHNTTKPHSTTQSQPTTTNNNNNKPHNRTTLVDPLAPTLKMVNTDQNFMKHLTNTLMVNNLVEINSNLIKMLLQPGQPHNSNSSNNNNNITKDSPTITKPLNQRLNHQTDDSSLQGNSI